MKYAIVSKQPAITGLSDSWQGLHKAVFHCDYFLHWAYTPDQHVLATFILALEINFERALYLHDEGYKTGDDYDLPHPLRKSTHIYVEPSVVIASLNPMDYQNQWYPPLCQTPKQRPEESPLHWGWLNLNKSPLSALDSDDYVEGNFPTAPLDDLVCSKEPILDRDLCIHITPEKSEASYPSQIPTPLQESIKGFHNPSTTYG